MLDSSIYLLQCREVTIFKLKEDIEEAEHRLMFLLDYANMGGMLSAIKHTYIY